MIRTWTVRLEVARDDNTSLTDEGIQALTELLTKGGAKPVLTSGETGTMAVEMTLDARNEMEAQSAAEHLLRESANTVWASLGLPPFTIAFVDVTEAPKP
jgi:hypothetical protein